MTKRTYRTKCLFGLYSSWEGPSRWERHGSSGRQGNRSRKLSDHLSTTNRKQYTEVGKSLWSPSGYLLRWHVSSEVPPPKSPHQHPQPGTKSSNRWVYRGICHSNHRNLFYFMCMFYDPTSFTKVAYRNIGALLMATLLKKVSFPPQQLLTAYICSGGVKSPETFPLLNWLKH